MGQTQRIGKHATTVRPVALYQYYDSNGKLQQLQDATVVTYHDTDVFVASGNDTHGYTVILNTGGWRTPTTKNRMNQAFNEYGFYIGVTQIKGIWYLVYTGRKEAVHHEIPSDMVITRISVHDIPTPPETIFPVA